jgi:hypothetical protein
MRNKCRGKIAILWDGTTGIGNNLTILLATIWRIQALERKPRGAYPNRISWRLECL